MGWRDTAKPINGSSYLDRLEAEKELEKTGRSADPAQQIRSSREARKFFDVDTAQEIQRGDIHNANNLLGIDSRGQLSFDRNGDPRSGIRSSQMEGPWEYHQMQSAGDVDRGLHFMGDKINHNPIYERESAPLNSSLLDPLYSASDAVRDTVNEYVPAIGKAIDGADNWLFNATGGLLGTPSNITPENQLNLRKAFRDQKEKDDAYRFERR